MYIKVENIVKINLDLLNEDINNDFIYVELDSTVLNKKNIENFITKYGIIGGDFLFELMNACDSIWVSLSRRYSYTSGTLYYSNETPIELVATKMGDKIKMFQVGIFIYQLETFYKFKKSQLNVISFFENDEIYKLYNDAGIGDNTAVKSIEEVLSDLNYGYSIHDLNDKEIEMIVNYKPVFEFSKDDIIRKIEIEGIDSLTDEELNFLKNS